MKTFPLFTVAVLASLFFVRPLFAGYEMRVLTPKAPLSPGVTNKVRFSVVNTDTLVPLKAADLKVEHEKLIHLFFVDTGFNQYLHEHPEEVEAGVWEVALTPTISGKFKGWIQVRPLLAKGTQLLNFETTVLNTKERLESIDGDYKVTLSFPSGEPKQHAMTNAKFVVEKKGVVIATSALENYLGAKFHVSGVSASQQDFIHSHPGHGPAGAAPTEDSLQIHFMESGFYSVYAQFVHEGKVRTAQFGTNVASH